MQNEKEIAYKILVYSKFLRITLNSVHTGTHSHTDRFEIITYSSQVYLVFHLRRWFCEIHKFLLICFVRSICADLKQLVYILYAFAHFILLFLFSFVYAIVECKINTMEPNKTKTTESTGVYINITKT